MLLSIHGTKEIRMADIQKETVKQAQKPRQRRQSFSIPTSKLEISQQLEGYHYRWINDEPGRIAKALASGYVFAEPEEVGREADRDNKVSILGGANKDGSPLQVYLMRIPMEYYLEDQEIAQGRLDELDNAIRGGKLDRAVGDGRYVPDGGISYKPNKQRT